MSLDQILVMGMEPWMWVAMLIVPTVIVGALVWFGLYLFRRLADRGATEARRILEERFARGEIDQDESQRREWVLRDADQRAH
jgi:putative membrane protein